MKFSVKDWRCLQARAAGTDLEAWFRRGAENGLVPHSDDEFTQSRVLGLALVKTAFLHRGGMIGLNTPERRIVFASYRESSPLYFVEVCDVVRIAAENQDLPALVTAGSLASIA